MSLRGNLSGVEGTYPPAEIIRNVPYRHIVVNPSLPNVSEVYKGLSGDAAAGMKQAISQGLDKIKPLGYVQKLYFMMVWGKLKYI